MSKKKNESPFGEMFAYLVMTGVFTTILWAFIPVDSGRIWTGVFLVIFYLIVHFDQKKKTKRRKNAATPWEEPTQ
jgi:hypothetical protein